MGTTGGGGASARVPSNAESILRRQFETAVNNNRTAMKNFSTTLLNHSAAANNHSTAQQMFRSSFPQLITPSFQAFFPPNLNPFTQQVGEGGGAGAPIANKRRKIEEEQPPPSACSSTVKKIEAKEDAGSAIGGGEGAKGVDSMRKRVALGDGMSENGPMLKDLGGMDGIIEELTRKVLVPFHHPNLQRRAGTKPITGILLNGPPGCGKTTLARAIANETRVPLHEIAATGLVGRFIGDSEKNIVDLFSKAIKTAPSVVFIDEIDAIASKKGKNSQSGFEDRIVTQLMASMDEARKLVKNPSDKNGYVLVIGATNRPDSIDSALRRPGRFDHEFHLGVPNENARAQILSRLTRNVRVDGGFDVGKIASATPGFVGADLEALIDEAANLAIVKLLEKRKINNGSEDYWKPPSSDEEGESLTITMADIEAAAKLVQPSTKREGFSEIPNVKWDDIGGLHSLRQEFELHIIRRIKSPQDYEEFGIDQQVGFLLYGPPGCGKTLIAKAVANEAGANFIYIKGPELLKKYVGEGELAVRTLFSRARTCTPCILFFDEVDALTATSGKTTTYAYDKLLKQLLVELDGAEQRRGVYVIGATNRPDTMDRAMLRPGRFGKLMYVPLPTPDERGMILKALARNKPIDANVDLVALGKDIRCHKLSGADLSALMNEAAMAALVDKQSSSDTSSRVPCTIKDVHFATAFKKVSPSVSDEQIQQYKLLAESSELKG